MGDDGHPPRKPPSILAPGKRFVLTPTDLQVYSDLLAKAFPEAHYYCECEPETVGKDESEPAPVAVRRTLADCGRHPVRMFFGPVDGLRWERTEPHGWWRWTGCGSPNASIELGGDLREGTSEHPPLIAEGRIYFRCRKGDKKHMAVARKALRLIGKVASNRRVARVRYPSLVEIGRRESGYDLWIGHDARRWLLEEPDRMTEYSHYHKTGIRPYEEGRCLSRGAGPIDDTREGGRLLIANVQPAGTGGQSGISGDRGRIPRRVSVPAPGRRFVLSVTDRRTYSDLLAGAFPEAYYYDEPSGVDDYAPEPPALPIHRRLADCRSGRVRMCFDPAWTSRWRREEPYGKWELDVPESPTATIELGGDLREGTSEHPPLIAEGRIYFRCRKGDKVHMAVARKALRLIGKVASNRRIRFLRCPEFREVGRRESGYDLWIGHDARRWLLEAPDRMTDFDHLTKFGARPYE